ncbi:hypothetical protein [Bradyrhizobium japonicum]|uniref:hypothetical protein n=1 Tax=Bradyrhizobium japonicum TaxID=375 RepID=UPI00118194F5|nr:hypothetical protein [Bradyrhizobium japonicum]
MMSFWSREYRPLVSLCTAFLNFHLFPGVISSSLPFGDVMILAGVVLSLLFLFSGKFVTWCFRDF